VGADTGGGAEIPGWAPPQEPADPTDRGAESTRAGGGGVGLGCAGDGGTDRDGNANCKSSSSFFLD